MADGTLDTGLVKIWPSFVNCRERLRTLLPFLAEHIAPAGRVIDLAAGIGCEAVALAKRGYRVTANEVNPALRHLAEMRARQLRHRLAWTESDWRAISTEVRDTFDALLLLGNSLCLLLDEDDRRQSLKEFFALCAHDGVFIVDVRNFTNQSLV